MTPLLDATSLITHMFFREHMDSDVGFTACKGLESLPGMRLVLAYMRMLVTDVVYFRNLYNLSL